VMKEVLMIELVMHTMKNDMVIHTEKTGMMRLVVEIEYVGKIADVFDKATWSYDGLQPKQVDLNSILLLHESYMSFSNIGGRLSAPERIALSARVVIVKFVLLKIT
nr:hypothetical protein [Tanacetum cinerariifolium]